MDFVKGILRYAQNDAGRGDMTAFTTPYKNKYESPTFFM